MTTIIVTGNPVDGFTFYGPFEDGVEAQDWATAFLDGDWWGANLRQPEPTYTT